MGYGKLLARVIEASNLHYRPMTPMQNGVNANISDVYKNLDRV